MVEFVGFSNVVQVGQGGLGRVYRAEKDSTGGVVAIKELTAVAEGSAAWHRARRELEAMLRLKGHPYVVSVEEILQGPNGPLLVMEYLPGGSLAERVETGPLSAPEIVLVGQHVSQALAAAHDVGIVHRDIKPHNLLIGAFGQIKVCDFGISALARGDGRTQTNAMTMAYAAPEELDGDEHIGPPADVYSLSATLLHLITGQRPTFRDRMSGAWVAPDGLDPALEPVIDTIRQGLSYNPDDRPTTNHYLGIFDNAAHTLGAKSLRSLTGRPQTASGFDTSTAPAAAVADTIARADNRDHDEPDDPVPQTDATVIRSTSTTGAQVSPVQAVPASNKTRKRRRLLLASGAAVLIAGLAAATAGIVTSSDSQGTADTTDNASVDTAPAIAPNGTDIASVDTAPAIVPDGSSISTSPSAQGDALFVSTFAGSSNAGSTDGPASTATFNGPTGVTVDAVGNVYVADSLSNKIRKISPDGIVSTLAGTGIPDSTDGPASTATFNDPSAVAVDAAGNIYVADSANNKIRIISRDGTVFTLAGTGTPDSTDGPANTATFNYPHGVAVDGLGNVYVADTFGNKIRKISPDGTVTTLASTATFNAPYGVAVDAVGNVYVADTTNKIRKISPDGTVTTLAGTGDRGSTDGPANTATFKSPTGVTVDAVGNVYVADTDNYKIRKVSPDGNVTTLAGTGTAGSADGPANTATFLYPYGVAVDATGNVYVADTDINGGLSGRIRKISPQAPG